MSWGRPLGAGGPPLVMQVVASQICGYARAAACCLALSLFGLMRMLSKNLDESMGMADYDNAIRKASSLDIAITLPVLRRGPSRLTIPPKRR